MEIVKTGNNAFLKEILSVAVPVSMQSLFQSSFSLIDQVMAGQLGTCSIAAIGLGSKFPNVYIISLAAIGTSASIMISQYCGKKDSRGINQSLIINSIFGIIITILFLLPSLLLSKRIISLYTNDAETMVMAASYLKIIALGYIPLLITTMLSALLRNTGNASLPMISGIISVILNTGLGYILIFGKYGAPKLGITGTAAAATAARLIECLVLAILYIKASKRSFFKLRLSCKIPVTFLKKAMIIGSPIIINEFLWGLGDTMYGVIYGHIGTEEMAAMTITGPLQGISIGFFTGISAAAAIMAGNMLGREDKENAYIISIKFIKIGIICSVVLGLILTISTKSYLALFNISEYTSKTAEVITYIFSLVLFIKVSNMIIAGGIIRSGGKTKYSLYLDLLGTWGIGVPIGFASAFLWKMPIYEVYILISSEELVRFIIELFILKSKKWMQNITA